MKFSDNDICSGCVFEDGEDKNQCKIKEYGKDKDCPCVECLLKGICTHVCSTYDKLVNEIKILD